MEIKEANNLSKKVVPDLKKIINLKLNLVYALEKDISDLELLITNLKGDSSITL